MSYLSKGLVAFSLSAVMTVSAASAAPISYHEDFDNNNANWRTNDTNVGTTWINAGGPNGASDEFVRTSLVADDLNNAVVVFRARATFDSSNDLIFGNWISGGVYKLEFWFRHDAPDALNLGFRVPTTMGFPAMLGRFPTQVEPNTWTRMSMLINNTNPELLDETGPTHNNYNAVFSNITNFQIFADLAAYTDPTSINFDLDHFTVLPEPSTWLMAAIGIPALGLMARLRRRKAKAA